MLSPHTFAVVATGLLSIVNARPTANTTNSVIDLGYAQYQGVSNSSLGITTYYGLQYAAPPTGSQRWRPPVPIENSTYAQNLTGSILNATSPQYQCVQGRPGWYEELNTFVTRSGENFGVSPQIQNEDCLRLDVYVPNSPVSSSLPVAIQIHGGGYTVGSSLTSPGPYFTSYSNGSVIYVAIQYRLGFYGFLGNEEVMQNGTANAGLLDQRVAIEWVQRNIQKFGGDPNQVTIWGGSAGGGSVTAQLIINGGEENPPFRAAIPEYPWWQPFHNSTVLETQYSQLLNASNCTDLTCLRNLSADGLSQANQQVFDVGYAAGSYGYGDFYAGPSVDGAIIPTLPSQAFDNGNFSKVPLLTDREGFEGVFFSNFSITTESEVQPDLEILWRQTNETAPSFFTRLFQLYPTDDFSGAYFDNPFFSTISSAEPNTTNNTAYYQRADIFGDFIIDCPTYYMATAMTDYNMSVYKLVFQAGTELHGSTGPFLVGPNDIVAPGANATVSALMKDYWLGFIVNLDPNMDVGNSSIDKPMWPTYLADGESGGFQVLMINQTEIGARPDPDANDRCDFFHGQSEIVRN